MATKTIVTRIKNKIDTIAKWNTYTGTLLDGEIAIVKVPTGDTYTNPVTGASEPVIELLMKVGDGVHKFNEVDSDGNPYLPWLSAKASDVYNWAKLPNPVDMPVTVGGTASTLGAYLTKVNTNAANIASNDTDIATLNNKVDVTKVSTAISSAINALNSTSSGTGNFVKAVSQTNGEVSVTMGTIAESELPSISTDKVYLASATGTTLTSKLSAMDTAIAGKSDTHNHPYLPDTTKYAGSATKGGAANSVKEALTFSTSGNGDANGTTYNGSTARTISYNSVGAAATSHTHDERYYTETEIDTKVAALNTAIDGKAVSGHIHDDRYYTETEVDDKIAAAVSSALKYKGTKNTTSELPTSGNAIGDVWNITSACDAITELPKVNAGDNVAWNGSAWDVLAGTVDLSSYYTASTVDTKLASKSDTDHTHKYAGSSSAGGAATSANKVNKSLTIKLNSGATEGTDLFTFNGSAAKSINITPSAIGAATSGHNHDDKYYTESEVNTLLAAKSDTHNHPYLPDTTKYAASDSAGGSATSAVKVNNSLTVTLNSGSTEGTDKFTFNGSAAKTVNVTASGIGAYTKAETDALLAGKQASGSYASSSHAHGNITNSGTITSTAVTQATGVLVYDSNNKIQRATAANARAIIGAGTSSLTIGTTATTAAAGNHTHSTYAAKTDFTAVEGNYVRCGTDSKLYVGKSGTDEIIFDCGGAD